MSLMWAYLGTKRYNLKNMDILYFLSSLRVNISFSKNDELIKFYLSDF